MTEPSPEVIEAAASAMKVLARPYVASSAALDDYYTAMARAALNAAGAAVERDSTVGPAKDVTFGNASAPDVVIDLETLGIAGDAAIVSIGAASSSGAEFYMSIASPSGSVNPATIRWWMAQREEVRAVWLTEGDDEVAVLLTFGKWLAGERGEHERLRLWGSEDFDTALLKDAYARNKLPPPWHYQESRGLRTAFDLMGVDEDAHPWEERIEHIAVDCARQALIVLRAAMGVAS